MYTSMCRLSTGLCVEESDTTTLSEYTELMEDKPAKHCCWQDFTGQGDARCLIKISEFRIHIRLRNNVR